MTPYQINALLEQAKKAEERQQRAVERAQAQAAR